MFFGGCEAFANFDNRVAILQYANDTVLCIKHDPEEALNLKMLFYMFEMMSMLKINFLKK
jgi:hypothetical protein